MTPAEKEIRAVNDAYSRALAAYGAKVVVDSLATWDAISVLNVGGRALLEAQLLSLTLTTRTTLATLAVRRAQLVQALRKGTQLRGPDQGRTLQDLRDAFNDSLQQAGVMRALRARDLDPGQEIPVDPRNGSLESLITQVNDNENVITEITGTIRNLGNGRLAKLARREGIVTPRDISVSRSLVAGGVERISLNGARDTDNNVINLNKDVFGVIRMHNSHAGDDPCAFCAMLLSRGAVYLSARSAGQTYNAETKEWEQYHRNCHCTAEFVYSRNDWLTNPAYKLNRELHQEWNRVIKGKYHYTDNMSVWREHMKTYFSNREVVSAAQEAA